MTTLKVNVTQAKELIKHQAGMLISHPGIVLKPLYLEGHAGIGKTQLARQTAEELTREYGPLLKGDSFRCSVLNLQFCERPDLMGLPYVTASKETAFARPMILPESGFGILLLDEANRVERDIRSGLLSLLEDREINGHKLGKQWLVILAGNPADSGDGEGNYEVGEFDTALLDRVSRLQLVGDADKLIQYLDQKYHGHFLVEFLKLNRTLVSFVGNGTSPRSFEYAIKSTLRYKSMTNELLVRVLASELGIETAKLAFAFHHSRTPGIGLGRILAGDQSAFSYLKENSSRHDVIGVLNSELQISLREHVELNKEYSESEVKNIHRYLLTIRDEFKVALLRSLGAQELHAVITKVVHSNEALRTFVLRVFERTAA